MKGWQYMKPSSSHWGSHHKNNGTMNYVQAEEESLQNRKQRQ